MESRLAFFKAIQIYFFFPKTASTSFPWLVPLLLFTLLKPMSLPGALINTLLCALRLMPLQTLLHKNLLVYKDTEPGEGTDPPWAN